MDNTKRIAILCNYELLPERVGGMDYFFWQFDANCKLNSIQVDWFFPNKATHGQYSTMIINSSNGQAIESFFLDYCQKNQIAYSHVVTHFIELCTPFFYKLSKISKAKVIGVDHNPRPLNGYALKKKIEKKVKGILFSKYIDLFVGVSEASKNDLISDFGFHIKGKAKVIFNGLNFNQFIIKKDFQSSNKFIIACHLRKEKGVQDVIEAIKKLNNFDFTIAIYGEGNYESVLREMVQKYSLDKIITFKGSVANLFEIYSQYDYLIHPSHGETFCYSVVESLLCQLPVITTRHQGNVLGLVTDNINGFLFDEVDIDGLTTIIKNILMDKSAINNWCNTPALSHFSLDKMVQNHLQLVL
ncbi:glycosyltransferase involved in cell wall biosynthesis [Flavobacterium sp. 7E]|uniref:glycosyltransferase family 4 protein n=1 Tax=Flavobacterium sp. 7E TaxID=2735898 RepID=UPI00156ED99E|nr:glycosyltransferase family 4 protein [Flavobacterium sp. 7E]NRS89408.1 glycosyltransferase involved in cell wall biosynthesis [Flavobacterium sp. 7E]